MRGALLVKVWPLWLRALGRLGLVLILVFVGAVCLLKLSPLDPVGNWAGPAAMRLSPERREEILAIWGHDVPLGTQLRLWAGALLRGDLGYSISYGTPVWKVLADRLGPSMILGGGAWLLSGVLGFALGAVAARFEGRWPDHLIRTLCLTLAVTPAFWLAMMLLALFSVTLGWTPICCAAPLGVTPDQVTLGMRLQHLILPLSVLTAFGLAPIALHSRLKIIEALALDPALFARAQGAGEWDILLRHALRHAALPVVAILFAGMGEVIGGTILAEQVFAWPGLGQAIIEAGLRADMALLLALTLLTAVVVASGNLCADHLARGLSPQLAKGGI